MRSCNFFYPSFLAATAMGGIPSCAKRESGRFAELRPSLSWNHFCKKSSLFMSVWSHNWHMHEKNAKWSDVIDITSAIELQSIRKPLKSQKPTHRPANYIIFPSPSCPTSYPFSDSRGNFHQHDLHFCFDKAPKNISSCHLVSQSWRITHHWWQFNESETFFQP